MGLVHPLYVGEVSLPLREIVRLGVVSERHFHATELTLEHRVSPGVGAGIRLASLPCLLHTGWTVHGLGLTVAEACPLTSVHAVLPTSLHRVTPTPTPSPAMGKLIQLGHTVVHCGELHRRHRARKDLSRQKKRKNTKKENKDAKTTLNVYKNC